MPYTEQASSKMLQSNKAGRPHDKESKSFKESKITPTPLHTSHKNLHLLIDRTKERRQKVLHDRSKKCVGRIVKKKQKKKLPGILKQC